MLNGAILSTYARAASDGEMSEPPPSVPWSGSLNVNRCVDLEGSLRSWLRSSSREMRLCSSGTNSIFPKALGRLLGYGDQLKYHVIGDLPPRKML